ncbi:RING-14 protein-like protein [Aulographum hederae CBS 113979]|uniref:RING-14 protein-like protein n=1 Tax=Aulographum hederae CBS 113979 TaxID=1176131 RepID=A0A6G1H4M0_9PEZI|nr:RING-14 protein-like protein [Aulographum hederae CBS 113979]
MKFAQEYQKHLAQDGYPPHWVASAISYRQLKKCIKKVQKELSELGLDGETLSEALRSQYVLSGCENGSVKGQFVPKLLVAVDEATGEPLDAKLAPETRTFLQELAVSQQLSDTRITDVSTDLSSRRSSSDDESSLESQEYRTIKMIEVPLSSDSEFFSMLQDELSGLTELQEQEKFQLNRQVLALSHAVAKITESSSSKSKHDLQQWRKIFELYLSGNIFFSTAEQDHGAHNYAKAHQRLQKFTKDLNSQVKMTVFKRKESQVFLQQFLSINLELLQNLKYQEMNFTAMNKILKKFDKRTSLSVQPNFPPTLSSTLLSQSTSKAICASLSTSLISLIPQIDDYLCPVCFSLAWRPVRLRCQHVFCIRCLIVLQREGQDHCPLCRGCVVIEADVDNLDDDMAKFMRKWFPGDVKAKQKENERATAIDLYGPAYDTKCCVM